MSNSLITTGHIDFANQEVVKTLQATVAKGTTPEEFTIFAHFCKSTGLNPLKKEVWCIKTGAGLQIMTGLNGYREIANRHPEYDGLEGPDYTYDAEGRLTGCEVRVYRKDRSRPAKGVAILSEVMGQSPVWKQRPHQMLNKCAEVDAYRKAFPSELNGTYAEEEMPVTYSAASIVAAPTDYATKEEILELLETFKSAGFETKDACLKWAGEFLKKPVKWSAIEKGDYALLASEALIMADEKAMEVAA